MCGYVSSSSLISCFWNFTAFGPGVLEEAEFFSKKIVLLQKFVIQPKRYRRTCTHPINARGLRAEAILKKNSKNETFAP
jgi:hypothetical protein